MTIRPSSAFPSPCWRRLAQHAAPLLLCLPLAGCGMLPSRLSMPWSDPAPAVAPPAQVRTAPAGTAPAVDWNGNPIAPPRPAATAGAGSGAAAAPAGPAPAGAAPGADAGQAALDAALAPVPGDARNPAPGSRALGEDAVAARQFRQLDTNGDGVLDADEVAGLPRLREALAAADADRDGRLSFEELRRFALQQRAARAGADDAPPPAAATGAQEAPAAAVPRIAPPSSGGIGLRPSTGR